MNSHPQSIFRATTLMLALAAIGMATLHSSPVYANPQGGQVVAGSATITQQTPSKVAIIQTTDKAIVNWQSYSIAPNEQVQYYQPSAASVTLNRVVGADPSQILGRLTANGQVFLVNPNGIYFGRNAQIDVAGLVASTHNIRNEDFMAGRYNFTLPGKPGAAVINEGTIHISDTGIAAFVAPSVANRGIIVARLGRVMLASANGFTLDFSGDQLVTFLVNDQVAQTAFDLQGNPLTSFVENAGRIEAQGGYVLLSAKAAENAIHSVINQTGVIEATTVGTHNGAIILNAGTGSLNVSGTLDASAPSIPQSAISNQQLSGGFIETSGAHVTIDPKAVITTAAPFGKTGRWLIDPVDFTIAVSGGDMTGAALSSAIGLNNVLIQSISGAAGTAGDVNVNDVVSWSANKLTLNAQNNININATMNGSGTASLALEYGQGALAAGNLSDYIVHAAVNLPAGQNFSTKLGSDGMVKNYAVITSLGAAGSVTGTDLQGMKGNLAGNYVLGANIDATATSTWQIYLAGIYNFTPIGNLTGAFNGTFDGLGHTISNLTTRGGNSGSPMFGQTGVGSVIRNVGLMNNVGGALVGINYGTVDNSYTTGNVIGDMGGLVSRNFGLISNSYATGNVNSAYAGGLVGLNSGTISNSHATGTVSGTGKYSGGLVGFNLGGSIANSYATGNVNGTGARGLVGTSSSGTITNSYYDADTVLINGVINFSKYSLDHVQFQDWLNHGMSLGNINIVNYGSSLIYDSVSGSYLIGNVQGMKDLLGFADNPAYKFKLTSNIDLIGLPGYYIPSFSGLEFNGASYIISNLSINTQGLFSENAGMFGNLSSGSAIRNLGLSGVSVSIDTSGALASVGGMVGYNNGGMIDNSYITGNTSVHGLWVVGGLVGYNNAGTISNSYATGNVSGFGSGGGSSGGIGGLV